MRLTQWVPWMKKNEWVEDDYFTPMNLLEKQMNQLFEPWFDEHKKLDQLQKTFSPKMNISEDTTHFEVTAELPGLEIKDIHMEYKGDTLYLTGEKKMEEKREDKNFYRMEATYGHFSRAIPFPVGVNPDQIEAQFNNGLLKVRIPKPAQIQEKKRTIPIANK
ncbi:MAG: Hsp20/alpha crystallin family protein [Acidobacteria bacterium]|nr:Hsp20/alpha crystallin family protein [Acidobacteriota bacterium]